MSLQVSSWYQLGLADEYSLPHSKGATGNVATEDLLHLLHSLGCETGIDIVKMADYASFIF